MHNETTTETGAVPGHVASPVSAYNAPSVPESLEPLPVAEGAGQGQARLLVPGKTYVADYATDWSNGARTTYHVQGVGAFEVAPVTYCYQCGEDAWGRPEPCRHVEVTYGRGPRYASGRDRADLPVINRVTLVGGARHMDPQAEPPGYFTARRPRGPYLTEEAPDKTAAKLGALVHALAQHWDGLAESTVMRAAAARALAVRRYEEAVIEQKRIREQIASDREDLDRAEAVAGHYAALANTTSYDQAEALVQDPPAPRYEYNVYSVCGGFAEDEPMVVMVTRSIVLSEEDDDEGRGLVVCTDTVSASSAQEAARILREDHQFRHGV